MFPKNIKFVGTPVRLQQAIDALPAVKGNVRSSQSKDNALRGKLLQIETTQLREWKLKPAMLRRIPALARERSNTLLQEKILAIAVTSLENMDGATMQELTALLWQYQEYRLAINAHFARKVPTCQGWLQQYYKAFRTEDPPKAIAQSIPDSISLYALHKHLGMQTSNPLFLDIAKAYGEQVSLSDVSSWSWSKLLDFLHSGYPIVVKQRVLEWVLREYCTDVALTQVLNVEGTDGPLHRLFLVATQFSTPWKRRLPKITQQHIRCVQRFQELNRWLSTKEVHRWKSLLQYIQSVSVHRPSGWLCVLFDTGALIWPMVKQNTALYWMHRSHFRTMMVPKMLQSTPIAITQWDQQMSKTDDWQVLLEQWINPAVQDIEISSESGAER
mgnify:CR=1 FL=1